MSSTRSLFTFEKISKAEILEIIFSNNPDSMVLNKEDLLENTPALENLTMAKFGKSHSINEKTERLSWNELDDHLMCTDGDSAISSPIAEKILNDFYGRFGSQLPRILSFRRRIRKNSVDQKFERLLLAGNYSENLREMNSSKKMKKIVKHKKKYLLNPFNSFSRKVSNILEGYMQEQDYTLIGESEK